MTTFLGSYERPRRQPLGETSRIGRLVRLSEDTLSAVVELGNEQFELPVSPGKYVLGANVAVLESKGKPRRVSGPAGVWPEGLDADADAPDTVTAVEQLGPRELTETEAQAIQDTADNLAEAQADLADAFERIGNLATEVGFAWSGHSEETDAYPPGTNFRVDWTALGGGEFRLEMKNIPTGANYAWNIGPPGESNTFIPDVNPVVVTATEPGSMYVYAWADDENIAAEFDFEVHPGMLDATGPLQAAIADASAAAVRASRIAPRSRREPTIEDGDNRPVGSVWTQVNAEGEELAYWAWDGTEWVPQALSTQVIPYLDAAHISTGVMDADRINVTEIWGQIATFGRIITSDLLATGAVTSRHLNVVPEEGTGGMELLPPGLRIIPSDAEAGTAVSLRIDEENWIAFAKNNENTFAVDEFGHISGESLDVRDGISVQGIPLSDLINVLPRGNLGRVRMSGTNPSVGTASARLMQCSIRTPSDNRLIRISVSLSSNAGDPRRGTINVRQTTQDNVTALNSSIKRWDFQTHFAESNDYSFEASSEELGWPLDETITIGVFVNSGTEGESIPYMTARDQTLTIDDVGPVTELQQSPAYVPTSGGGSGGDGSEADTGTRYHDGKFYPASNMTRSYRGNNTHYNWNENMLFHGYNLSANGQLRSMAIFNRTAVNALTTGPGTEMVSGHIKLYNSHTWANSGMTVRVGYVSTYTSPPSTWNGTTNFTWIGNYTVSRGGVITIPLTSTLLAQIKSGGFRGIGLVSNSDLGAQYGYFNASKTELYVKVRK